MLLSHITSGLTTPVTCSSTEAARMIAAIPTQCRPKSRPEYALSRGLGISTIVYPGGSGTAYWAGNVDMTFALEVMKVRGKLLLVTSHKPVEEQMLDMVYLS